MGRHAGLADEAGAIVAAITFTGSHTEDGCCAPWGEPNVHHWTIADDITVLPEPVSWPGSQGFWTPPQNVLEAVHSQLDSVA